MAGGSGRPGGAGLVRCWGDVYSTARKARAWVQVIVGLVSSSSSSSSSSRNSNSNRVAVADRPCQTKT
eukprot:6761029-Pyramimonas_sp.AAC.2